MVSSEKLECNHRDILISPKAIRPTKHGFIISDPLLGQTICKKCHEPIPAEDVYLYDEKHIFIAIPENLV